MYNGKYSDPPKKHTRRRRSRRTPLTVVAVLLLLATAIGGTLAFLTDNTNDVTNTFTPGNIDTTVVEEFKDNVKSSIKVENTGNIDAYIRVKLISYRVNENGDRIGGTADIEMPGLANGWFLKDGYYYYPDPVAPNTSTENLLGGVITLTEYNDADGGKQVIEVMAEGIQAEGTTGNNVPAVTAAWGVTVRDGKLVQN